MIISFEGIPGVGKSTLVYKLNNYIKSCDLKSVSVRELDLIDGAKSQLMNSVMDVFSHSSDRYYRQIDPFIDTYLSQAVRYLICKETLDKHSPQYDYILEDRGVDTYYSYALAGLKIAHNYSFEDSLKLLYNINSIIDETADITFRLKDKVENCVSRSIRRGEGSVLKKDIGFVIEVNNAYNYLAEVFSKRIITLDVQGKDSDTVFKECLYELKKRGVLIGNNY